LLPSQNPAGKNCVSIRREYCSSMAYAWGHNMCSFERRQFVQPYCEGQTVKLGLYGADSTCGVLLESLTLEPDTCFEPYWLRDIYGPWFNMNPLDDPVASLRPYKMECGPNGLVRLRYFFFTKCSVMLNYTHEWPVDLCMDTSEEACNDWDPARWLEVRPPLRVPRR
jgi:hypothetical protein